MTDQMTAAELDEIREEQEAKHIEAMARFFVGEEGLREAQSLMYGDSREIEISYGVTVEKDGYGLTLTDRGGDTYYAHAPALFEHLDRELNPENYVPLNDDEQSRAHADRFISTYVGGSWADPRAIAEMLVKGEGEHKNEYSTWTVEDGKLTWENVHGQSDTVSADHAREAMVWPYGKLLKEAEAKFAAEQDATPTPTDTTLSADRFAAVMSAWPNGTEQLGYIAETALDGKANGHFDQTTTLEGEQLVMREGDKTLRTDATEYVAFMEREHPDLMKQAQANVTARDEAEFERQQDREAGKANASAEIDAVMGEIAVEPAAEKSLYQMIDAGEDRPAHVSEDDWKAAERAYFHQMSLENTPDEFIPGTAAYARENYIGSDPIKWDADEQAAVDVYERERTVDYLKESGGKYEEHGGVWAIEGEALTFTAANGDRSAWKLDDLATEVAPTAELLTMEGKTATADKADADNLMRLAEEIEHGFPSLDPMFDDLNSMIDTKSRMGIEHKSSADEADRSNVVDFKAMAADFKAAGQGATVKGRAVEAEQGA